MPGIQRKPPDNILRNGSFEEGVETPTHWEWVVTAGSARWAFGDERPFQTGRSVRISQDVGNVHGEFRQTVSCTGQTRYRVRARIRTGLEANCDSEGAPGANLRLVPLAGGKTMLDQYDRPLDMFFRPFFLGRHDWRLYQADYVTPAGAEMLIVACEVNNACGVAWFDEVELLEVPAPLPRSVDPPVAAMESLVGCAASSAAHQMGVGTRCAADIAAHPTRAAREMAAEAWCTANSVAHPTDFFVDELLRPLMAGGEVRVQRPAEFGQPSPSTATILFDRPSGLSFAGLCEQARDRLVILTPQVLAEILPTDVQTIRASHATVAPCARIEQAAAITRGFQVGDIIPFSICDDADGQFKQWQIQAEDAALQRLGFEVIARSASTACQQAVRPVILWKTIGRGGILVMDLSLLETRPTTAGEANPAVLILGNALGRPQTYFGTYVAAPFDFETFEENVRAVAASSRHIRLREEGKSYEGRPIFSLSVGPEDAPAFYVDGGIHPDEWAPSYGMLAYIARLAKDYEAHLPWATALLRRQRLLCLPLLHPDSWEHHTRLRHGIDLNRNFPVGWNDNTSSRKGPAPLSEPEARTVAELFAREKPFAAVSWHETSANTNWVGCPRFTANYRKYALSCPEIFRQLIDRDHFFWQQALWTQPHDERNYHYHYVESFPYLRHYKDVSPFELHYADSLGIEAILVEQVGNGDLGPFSTPQRTDLTARILEMLLGLQVGLVCRNCSGQNKRVSIPAATAGPAEAIVYAPDGSALDKHPLRVQDGAAVAEAILPPGSCLVVETP